MWIAVRLHGFENRDQTASYDSLPPLESEPLKKKIKTKTNTEKWILTDQTIPSFGPTEQADVGERNLMTFPTQKRE